MRASEERRGWPRQLPVNYSILGKFPQLPAGMQVLLCCPACRSDLSPGRSDLFCSNPVCRMRFPIVDDVPILINDSESLFARGDFIARRNTTHDLTRSPFKAWMDGWLPTLGRNLKAKDNYQLLARLLLQSSPQPMVLVVGGSIQGEGIEALASQPGIQLLETDVSFGPRTQIVCDSHCLPFEADSFDGVVIQAVLQYVPDPLKCVGEIERVLKPGGLVYAETAFMQQVVHGRYDFTRFTHLGVRRLFRGFEEVQSGPVAGPGMALAWAWHFFLLAFASTKLKRSLVHALARLTLFWLKYFDSFLINKRGTYDAASGFFFLGRQENRILSDRELVGLYRGAQ
jgi:SAM-dependent methyltransferase